MQKRISPASSISGAISLPGDKSISHRYAMIAAIAEGETRIHNYSTGADCHSTLNACGRWASKWRGRVPSSRSTAKGSTACARRRTTWMPETPAPPFACSRAFWRRSRSAARIFGDESLSRRPMQRIMTPLARNGRAHPGPRRKIPAARDRGGRLRPIEYALPVPSAQVKTCVLFAGLFAEGETSGDEPVRSRDHTEIALREFGADLTVERQRIRLAGRPTTRPGAS